MLKIKSAKFNSILSIVRLYLFILLLVHVVSCVWYGAITSSSSGWWLETDMNNKSLFQRYTTVFVHCLGLIIRSSPHPPVTAREEICASLISLVGACVQGTVFGQVAHLIASINGQNAQFNKQMGDIRERMNYHNFPTTLQVRAGPYGCRSRRS